MTNLRNFSIGKCNRRKNAWHLILNINGTRTKYSIGIVPPEFIVIDKTDRNFDRISDVYHKAPEYNSKIKRLKAEANDVIDELIRQGVDVTARRVREFQASRKIGKENVLDIWQKIPAVSKIKLSSAIYLSLLKFEKVKHRKLRFSSFDTKFIEEYIEGLLSGKISRNKKGLVNNTVSQYVDCLKRIIESAFIAKMHHNKDFQYFTKIFSSLNYKVIPRNYPALNKEEIKLLVNFDVKELSSEEVMGLDMCLVQYNTGMRFSDVKNLRKSEVIDGVIDKRSQKTAGVVKLKLSQSVLDILSKYSDGNDFYFENGPSEIKVNRIIRSIAKSAGLDRMVTQEYSKGSERIKETRPLYEIISTHCGRKTAGTFMAKSGDARKVQALLGHSNIATSQRYIDKLKAVDPVELF